MAQAPALRLASLLVQVELGRSNAALLHVAGELAQRHQSRVIGLAACEPIAFVGDGYVDSSRASQDRAERAGEMQQAEAQFCNALAGKVSDLQWRSDLAVDSLTDHLARQARCADLVLVGVHPGAHPGAHADSPIDSSRAVHLPRLLARIGRPVLLVPAHATGLPSFGRVVVAWKDSRQAQRAVSEALPLLARAAHVTVVEMVEMAPREDGSEVADFNAAHQRVADVALWLSSHGISAAALAEPAPDGELTALQNFVRSEGADLVVAGAYSHGRLREWALGGVTRDLLLQPERCTLLSH